MLLHGITTGTVERHFQFSAVTWFLKNAKEKPSFRLQRVNQGKGLKSSLTGSIFIYIVNMLNQPFPYGSPFIL